MSRFKNETPLPEKISPGTSKPVDDRLLRIDEAPTDRGEHGPSAPKSGPSFLMILLRALAPWNV